MITCRTLNRHQLRSSLAMRSRAPQASSQMATTARTCQLKVLNPRPSSSHCQLLSGASPVRPSSSAKMISAASSGQYSTAGPSRGPSVPISQRSAGSCCDSSIFPAGAPRSTTGVEVLNPISPSARQVTLTECSPGRIGNVSSPSSARKVCSMPSISTVVISASSGS